MIPLHDFIVRNFFPSFFLNNLAIVSQMRMGSFYMLARNLSLSAVLYFVLVSLARKVED